MFQGYDKPQHLMYGNMFQIQQSCCRVPDKPQHLMYGNMVANAESAGLLEG